ILPAVGHVLVGVGHHVLGALNGQVQQLLVALGQAQAPDAFQQVVPSGVHLSLGGVGVVQHVLGLGESLLKSSLGSVGDTLGGELHGIVIGLFQQGLVGGLTVDGEGV